MKRRGVIARFRRDYAAFGLWKTLRAFGIRAIQRVTGIKVLRAMYVTAVAPTFAAVPADLTAGFLDRDTLRRLSAQAQYDLSPGFLDAALSKGDECYAIMDGARLAAYGWYARTPTGVSDNLEAHFDAAYVYMYKGLYARRLSRPSPPRHRQGGGTRRLSGPRLQRTGVIRRERQSQLPQVQPSDGMPRYRVYLRDPDFREGRDLQDARLCGIRVQPGSDATLRR